MVYCKSGFFFVFFEHISFLDAAWVLYVACIDVENICFNQSNK